MTGRGPYQNRRVSPPANRQNTNNRLAGWSSDATPISRPRVGRPDQHRASSSSSGGFEHTWSYGRVVLAIVPASSPYAAAALGAAAFSLRESFVDEPAVVDSDVEPVYDFDTPPASTLARDWGGELPAAVRRDTDLGRQLLETALAKMERASGSTPHLYDAEGRPLVSSDDLESVTRTDDEKSCWVVPGVVRRYAVSLPDGPKTQLPCKCRSLTTPHVFTGRGGAPPFLPDLARPVWICSHCTRPTFGPEPPEETGTDILSETNPGPGREPVEVPHPGGPAREHERAITSHHDENGLYPWEGGDDS